jgi:hypothetical protein
MVLTPFQRFRSEITRWLSKVHPGRPAESRFVATLPALDERSVIQYVGHVNDASFGLAAPETVMFTGASAIPSRPWWRFWSKEPRTFRTTYHFTYRPGGWNTQTDSNGRRYPLDVYPKAEAS